MIASIRHHFACRVLAALLGLAAPGTPVLSIAADSAARCLKPAAGRRLPCHGAASAQSIAAKPALSATDEATTASRVASTPSATEKARPTTTDGADEPPCHGASDERPAAPPASAQSAETRADGRSARHDRHSSEREPAVANRSHAESTEHRTDAGALAQSETKSGPCCCNSVRIATTSRCGCGHDHSGAAIAPGDPTLVRGERAPFTPFDLRPYRPPLSNAPVRDADTPEPPPPVLAVG